MLSHGARAGFECFIESQEGKNPLVEYQTRNLKGSFPSSECYVEVIPGFVDGQLIAEYALMRNVGSNIVDEIYEEEDDQLYSRKLKFLPATTTDKPEEIKAGTKVFNRVGTIEVMIHRGIYREISTDLYQSPEIEDCTMDEKEKKMAFTVGTSEREPVEDVEAPSYDFIPRKKGDKFYKFVFKYRVHTELVKLGLKDDPEPQAKDTSLVPANTTMMTEGRNTANQLPEEVMVKVEEDPDEVIDQEQTVHQESEVIQEEDDLTKDQLKRRLQYLEATLAKSNAENKRLRGTRPKEEDVVDLTGIDDME
uniref:DUF7918 domain-containing protein n=1 Tax=Kwoniella bestiolae CBS 10118 TaxID=1296100 RepID=A0A1B9GE67_9TREE|nr:hypothetical protein I302_00845 [Kwoniella bestiolae CBS 10118]OCF29343.1 hypothetical protein I302_00845 [Kwoniella bestiolae CBS 10118]